MEYDALPYRLVVWLVSACWVFGEISFACRLVGCLALRVAAPLVVRVVAPLEVTPAPLEMVDPPLEMADLLLELADMLLETGIHPICPL